MIYFSIKKSKLRYSKVEDYSEVSRNLIRFQITCFGRLRLSFMILFQRSSLAEPFTVIIKEAQKALGVCNNLSQKRFITGTEPVEPDFATSDKSYATMIIFCGRRPGPSCSKPH